MLPRRAEEGTRESVDSGCRKLTAAWVREAAQKDPQIETCEFFEGLERAAADAVRLPQPALALDSCRGAELACRHVSLWSAHVAHSALC